jgi:hypothetical protein
VTQTPMGAIPCGFDPLRSLDPTKLTASECESRRRWSPVCELTSTPRAAACSHPAIGDRCCQAAVRKFCSSVENTGFLRLGPLARREELASYAHRA